MTFFIKKPLLPHFNEIIAQTRRLVKKDKNKTVNIL